MEKEIILVSSSGNVEYRIEKIEKKNSTELILFAFGEAWSSHIRDTRLLTIIEKDGSFKIKDLDTTKDMDIEYSEYIYILLSYTIKSNIKFYKEI